MKKRFLLAHAVHIGLCSSVLLAQDHPFTGRWALTTPSGQAAWLGLAEKDGHLSAEIMWGRGSVLPVDEVSVRDGVLTLQRRIPGKAGESRQTLTATTVDGGLMVASTLLKPDGKEQESGVSKATRLAKLPPRPDLTKIRWGQPQNLIANEGLQGWQAVDLDAPNGWKVNDGILSNRVIKVKGQRSANLRTLATFEDFKLTTELRTLPESNSGIYLRGVYEIQIAETYGKPLDSHNMGALYTRITPAVAAERPVGEWQTMEIILVDQHVTVILNGQVLIDNQAALGCTGGALTSDDSLPGPIMLQGDHSDIDFRNMVLTPVKK